MGKKAPNQKTEIKNESKFFPFKYFWTFRYHINEKIRQKRRKLHEFERTQAISEWADLKRISISAAGARKRRVARAQTHSNLTRFQVRLQSNE